MADQIFNVNSGFYNSVDQDRLYDAEDMNKPYKRIVSNGVFATPQGTPSTDLQVLSAGAGMGIIVKAGEGIFGDKWFQSPSDQSITVPNNTTLLGRLDSVIVQIDKRLSGRVGSIVYRTGEPASAPQPPEINTIPDVIEYRVANIQVTPSATYISQDLITDLRGSALCPWVTALIQQVDTSQLYNQWQAAYSQYYTTETDRFETWRDTEQEEFVEWKDTEQTGFSDWRSVQEGVFEGWSEAQKAAFEEWLATLTEQLQVTTSVVTASSQYTTTEDGEDSIPIEIIDFDKSKDALLVRINGLFLSEPTDYTIDATSENITLTHGLEAGQVVDLLAFKSLVVGDTESVVTLLNAIQDEIDELKAENNFTNLAITSSKWLNVSPTILQYKKRGKTVYLNGRIRCVASGESSDVIAQIPTGYRPDKTVWAINNVLTINVQGNLIANMDEVSEGDIHTIDISYPAKQES